MFLAVHNSDPRFQVAEVTLGAPAKETPYRRSLDLANAIHRASWTRDGATITQEVFASFPAKVIVVRWTADKPGGLSGVLQLADAHGAKTVIEGDTMTIAGEFPGYTYDGGKQWLPLHRVTLTSGGKAAPDISTVARLKQYRADQPDLGLEELLFKYGRYLMISSSREGGLPANLQGGGISFDMQLAWDVFNSTIEAAETLGVDKEFRDLLATKRDIMAKPKIGKWGQLQE